MLLHYSKVKLLIFFSIFYSNLQCLQAQQPDQVIELFRYGARAPVSLFDDQWSQTQLGELLPVGMLQHYERGKILAEKYPDLVASGYNPNDVHILSSSEKRCIESAMVHASSLFRGTSSTLKESPQKDLQESLIAKYTHHLSVDEAERGDYVPVEIELAKFGSEEELIFTGRNPFWCSNIKKYRKQNAGSGAMRHGWAIFQDSMNEINTYLSEEQKLTTLELVYHAFDAFNADIHASKVLPGRMTDIKLIESLDYAQAYFQYLDEQLQKVQKELTSFNTLRAIMDQMENFRKGKKAKKLVLFSGQGKNIFSVLSAFKVIFAECLQKNFEDHIQDRNISYPNCQSPGFASSLIFEFYNQTENPYVKVYYNDVLVPLCGAGKESCSYDDFLRLSMDAIGGSGNTEDWNKKCGGNSLNNSDWVMRVIIGAVVGGVILIGIASWIFINKRKKSAVVMFKSKKRHHGRHFSMVEESSIF